MSEYHIVSITLRRAVGDRAYHLVQSFEEDSLSAACARHIAYRRHVVFASVLRVGGTGERFSVAASRDIVENESRRQQEQREAELETFYGAQMDSAEKEPT